MSCNPVVSGQRSGAGKGTVPVIIIVSLIFCPVIAYCQSLPAEIKEKARERVWKKDPFAPPPAAEAPVVGKEDVPSLEVSAILYSGDKSSAVVSGKTVHIGDDLYGQKVVDIKKGYVILDSGKKRYRLELRK